MHFLFGYCVHSQALCLKHASHVASYKKKLRLPRKTEGSLVFKAFSLRSEAGTLSQGKGPGNEVELRALYSRPFAQSGHMIQNHTCWDTSCTVGLSGSRPRRTGASSFVLELPLCNLRPSMCVFVPCDRIMQRAYLLK